VGGQELVILLGAHGEGLPAPGNSSILVVNSLHLSFRMHCLLPLALSRHDRGPKQSHQPYYYGCNKQVMAVEMTLSRNVSVSLYRSYVWIWAVFHWSLSNVVEDSRREDASIGDQISSCYRSVSQSLW